MSGYGYQSVLGAVGGGVIAWIAIVAFRTRRLSFSLLFAWIAVAGFVGLTPVLSWMLRSPAGRIGVSPSGIVLAFAVTTLLFTLFRVSADVSQLRRYVAVGAAQNAILAARPVREPTSDILVIVPALNEEGAIGRVTSDIVAAGFDCLVIDDGSTDRTGREAAQAGAVVARHPLNLGVGAAIRTGLQYAYERGYDIVVQCDGDGQHDVTQVEALAHDLRERNVDLLIGSRWRPGGGYDAVTSSSRRLAIKTLARYASRAVGSPISDPTSGFRAFSRRLVLVSRAELGDHYLSDTFEFVVRTARAGYRVDEVSTVMRSRTTGVPSTAGLRLSLYAARAFAVTALRLAPPLTAPSREA